MDRKTDIAYYFRPADKDPRAKGLNYVCVYAEDIVPTGKWKFVKQGSLKGKDKHEMYIEVNFTRITKGSLYEIEIKQFLLFFGKKVRVKKDIVLKQKNQITWLNESLVQLFITTIYNCEIVK